MKSQGIQIDKAEEVIEKLNKRKQETYRWNKEQEINQHIKEYRQQTQ
jgi:adenylate kinase family enzyme